MKFYVVRVDSPYNTVPHLILKFPTEKGVGEMRGDQKNARIIMLEDLEKDREYSEDERGKEKGQRSNQVGTSRP